MSYPTQSKGASMAGVVLIIVVAILVAGGIWYATQSVSNSNDNTNNGAMMEDNSNAAVDTNTDDAIMEETNENANEAMMEDSTNTNGTMMEDTNADDSMRMDDNTNQSSMVPGEYRDYTEAAFAAASDRQRVLFFHASWCPDCKASDANITANEADLPDNVVVFKTDYDAQTVLKAKYGITYQHSFVLVDSGGNALTKWNGGGVDEIAAHVS